MDALQQEEYSKKCREHLAAVEKQLDVKDGNDLWAILDEIDQWLVMAIDLKTKKLKKNGDWREPQIATAHLKVVDDEGKEKEEKRREEEGEEGGEGKEKGDGDTEPGEGHGDEAAEPDNEERGKGKLDQVGGETEGEGEKEEVLDPVRRDEWRLLIRCLLSKFIPKACKTVLRKRYLMQTRQRVGAFLRNVMHITALHIITDTKLELIKNLSWLFDPELAFYPVYQSYRMGPAGQMITYYDAPAEQPGEYAMRVGRISVFMVDNVNAFGAAGGFDYIAERVAFTTRPIALGHLIRKCLKWPFAGNWWRRVQSAVFARVIGMDDTEFKAVTKEDLGRAMTVVEKLSKLLVNPLHKDVDSESCAEELEKFKLALAHKCLLSSNLEKRLYGINTVTNLINMAQRKDENKAKESTSTVGYSYYARSMLKSKSTKWLTTSHIVGWLEEKQIVELLFGKGVHFELISRSKDVLRVLSEFRRFGEEHVNLLWSAAVGKGKQERITDTIYDLFDHLTKDLEPELVAFLVQKIRATQVFDAKTLNLMKTLTLHQLLEDDDSARRIGGLQLYWDIIQDDHFISREISKEATNHLKEIVVRNRCEEYRRSFTQMCAQNIQQSRSVPQSLKLLLEIFDTFPVSSVIEDRGSLILGIDKEFGILDLFFADLLNYKQKALEKADKNRKESQLRDHVPSSPSLRPEEKEESDLNKQTLVGVEPHLKQMKTRLKFLHYILKYSTLTLPLHHLATLWSCVIDNSLTREEKDLGMNWLIKACGNRAVFDRAVMDEATKLIFEDKLCSALDYSSLSLNGLLCFIEYFRYFNCEKGKLEKVTPSWPVGKRPVYIVRDTAMVGLEALWTLVLRVEDETVAADAINELNELYDAEKLSPELKRRIGTIRDGYISTIMSHLEAANGQSGPKNTAIIRRCLTLLTTFLEDLEKQRAADAVAGVSAAVAEELITLYFYALRHETRFLLEVPNLATLRSLKLQAAQKIARPLKRIVFHLNTYSASVYDDDRTSVDERQSLRDLGLVDNHTIYFDLIGEDVEDDEDELAAAEFELIEEAVAASSAPATTPEAQTVHPPSYVLTNNQAYFKLLFSLLALDEQVAQMAWDLLAKLPTNTAMETSIVSFHTAEQAPKWAELIDPTSAFSLLYALRIVKAALQHDRETGDVSWSLQLVAQGGLRHLADVLCKQNQLLRGNLSKHCLLALLQIIESALALPQVPAAQIDAAIDSARLVEGLLSVIRRSADDTHAQPSDVDGQVVKSACALLVIFIRPSTAYKGRGRHLLDKLVSTQEFTDLLHLSLLISAEASIRIEIADLINTLYLAGGEEHRKYFLITLFDFLPKIAPDSQRCSEFFIVLSELIKHYRDLQTDVSSYGEGDQSWFGEPLVNTLTSLVKAHPIVEKAENSTPDQVLIGLLQIFKELAERLPQGVKQRAGSAAGGGLIEELFHKCLFEVPSGAFHGPLAPPKCKTKTSRTAAFALLGELTKGSAENHTLLLGLVRKFHLNEAKEGEIVPLGLEWNHSPAAGERSSTGFVGLKNLGCTCYMNSLLQQFFMMPDFRKGILSIDFPKEYDFSLLGSKKKKAEEEVEDDDDDAGAVIFDDDVVEEIYDDEVVIKNLFPKKKESKKKAPSVIGSDDLLVELQVMFGCLQESLRQFYNPRGFSFANKDYDGQPVDVSVQMDVDEFFNMLCDKLENKLKGTLQERLLQNIWCGKMSSQLICKECPHRSERDEQFYTISLDIQNKKDILEALQLYVRGDMLEGDNAYFCETCKKNVDTLKRSCVKELPNTLILHLKRFEFNFDTMRKVKLNDYCEFPETLNMLPYTREGLALQETKEDASTQPGASEEGEDGAPPAAIQEAEAQEPAPEIRPREYYEYELVGILVHRGVADSGHYYSFVKDRSSGAAQEGSWIEFNDKMVTEFSAKDIPAECYGGEETIMSYDTFTRSRIPKTVEKTRSAYMLIYQRKVPQPVDSSPPAEVDNNSGAVAAGTKPDQQLQQKPSEGCRVLLEHVWEDNMRFLHEKKLFDPAYFNFLWQLTELNSDSGTPETNATATVLMISLVDFKRLELALRTIQVATFFFLEVISHAKDREALPRFVDRLRKRYKESEEACRWLAALLINDKQMLAQLLLQCPTEEVRSSFAELLASVVETLLRDPLEQRNLLQSEYELAGACTADSKDKSPLARPLVDRVFSLLPEVSRYWRQFKEYFAFFLEFTSTGVAAKRYMLEKNAIGQFLHIYLGPDSPNIKERPHFKLGNRWDDPDYSTLISCVSLLARSCDLPRDRTMNQSSEEEEEEEQLPRDQSEEDDQAEPQPAETPKIAPAAVNLYPPTQEEGEPLVMAGWDFSFLAYEAFVKQLVKDRNKYVAAESATLLSHLIWENYTNTEMVMQVVRAAISRSSYDVLKPLLALVERLLAVEDSYTVIRVNNNLKELLEIFEDKKKLPKSTEINLKFLIHKLYERNVTARNYLNELYLSSLNSSYQPLAWIDHWLNTHHHDINDPGWLMIPVPDEYPVIEDVPAANDDGTVQVLLVDATTADAPYPPGSSEAAFTDSADSLHDRL